MFGCETSTRDLEMSQGFAGADSHVLATILDPFGAISVDFGPANYLRLEHCYIETVEASETSTL